MRFLKSLIHLGMVCHKPFSELNDSWDKQRLIVTAVTAATLTTTATHFQIITPSWCSITSIFAFLTFVLRPSEHPPCNLWSSACSQAAWCSGSQQRSSETTGPTTWIPLAFHLTRNDSASLSALLPPGLDSALTQRGYHPMDLQHDLFIQSSLAWI